MFWFNQPLKRNLNAFKSICGLRSITASFRKSIKDARNFTKKCILVLTFIMNKYILLVGAAIFQGRALAEDIDSLINFNITEPFMSVSIELLMDIFWTNTNNCRLLVLLMQAFMPFSRLDPTLLQLARLIQEVIPMARIPNGTTVCSKPLDL